MSHFNLGEVLWVDLLGLTENIDKAVIVKVGWSLSCLEILG